MYNFVKALKLFCEMSDVPVSWKKITRGLPKIRSFANDRAPTIEEIHKMTEYPDRRMKAILFTMASSGFRLGAWDYLRWKDIDQIIKNYNYLNPLIKEGISHSINLGLIPTRTASRSLVVSYRMFDRMYEEEDYGYDIREDEIAESVTLYNIFA